MRGVRDDVPSGLLSSIADQELMKDAVPKHLHDPDDPGVQEIKVVHLMFLRVPFRDSDPVILLVSSVRVGVALDSRRSRTEQQRHFPVLLGRGTKETPRTGTPGSMIVTHAVQFCKPWKRSGGYRPWAIQPIHGIVPVPIYTGSAGELNGASP